MNHTWTYEQIGKLVTMKAKGYDYNTISCVVGRTVSSCQGKMVLIKKAIGE